MLRSKNVRQVKPNPNDWHVNEFTSCELVEELVPVYDSKGNVVRKDSVKKRVYKEYDADEVAHKGISCDLFTLENQITSGVNMQPFTGTFITPDLSDSSELGEEAIQAIQSHVQTEQSVEPNNNNN